MGRRKKTIFLTLEGKNESFWLPPPFPIEEENTKDGFFHSRCIIFVKLSIELW